MSIRWKSEINSMIWNKFAGGNAVRITQGSAVHRTLAQVLKYVLFMFQSVATRFEPRVQNNS